MQRRLAIPIAIAALAIVSGWVLFVGLPRWYAPKPTAPVAAAPPPVSAERKITATLYYVSDDGSELIGVQREVPFGEPVLEQARRIIEAQIAPAAQHELVEEDVELRHQVFLGAIEGLPRATSASISGGDSANCFTTSSVAFCARTRSASDSSSRTTPSARPRCCKLGI